MPSATSGEAPSRDHALGLHRFLGITQIFGGVTLVAAYGLGAPSLPVDHAASIEVALGLLQIVVGVVAVARARALRTLILRWPGSFVITTLLASTGVMALGGSGDNPLFVTSAMCWQIAAGYALQGHRWIVASVGSVVAVGAIWVLVGAERGGYDADGNYATALIGLAVAVVPGLLLGRITGATFGTLNRWHLVEVHERGLAGRLRDQLRVVDERAARVGELLPVGTASVELAALRARLAMGAGAGDGATPTTLAAVMAEVAGEYECARPAAALAIELDGLARAAELSAVAAATLASVVQRQLGNVSRHAPDARTVTVLGHTDAGMLVIRIQDDGGGALNFRAGTGTTWSTRQLARVGGTARYYAGDSGVGFEVSVPIAATSSITDIPGISVRSSLDRFTAGMLGTMRCAGYAVDTLGAYVVHDDIGPRWLLMPLACLLMEGVIQFGVPGLALQRVGRLLVASAVAIAVTAGFAFPADSPEVLVPSTSTVVILAHLIAAGSVRWWLGAELLRAAAVAPLVARYGVEQVELTLIYPIGFSLMVLALVRFVHRALELERTSADAVGRAALAGATVRGLALHHDAIDVVLRHDDAGSLELRDAVDDLEAALAGLAATASGPLDPREVMLAAIQSAFVQPVRAGRADHTPSDGARTDALTGAVDRVTLVELSALAADDRAACTPPGLLGRRRLKALKMDWAVRGDGSTTELTLTARPSLQPPDRATVRRLEAVADTLGVAVTSTAGALTLRFARR